MIRYIHSAKCIGIDAVPVTVEVDITNGLGIHLVGLADIAVKESLLRTITALQSIGFKIPGKKIVINLAPADMHKKGSGYDLPIALGILAASEQVKLERLDRFLLMGELGLDGSLRNIPGALSIADYSASAGFDGCILPTESAEETVELEKGTVYGASCITDAINIIEGKKDMSHLIIRKNMQRSREESPILCDDIMDFSEIAGQEGAKRGLEIAAAGGHNVIMVGAPGSGKSSMAKAMSTILPPMTREEYIQTSKIYSIAGKHIPDARSRARPFRAPHYSASIPALLGGGSDTILPGEVSLAHNGILFLDEFCEAPKSVLEALRGPIEDGSLTISRLKSKVSFPARFMLVAATNPCPCGYWGEGDRCTCSPTQRAGHMAKLSGPMMDRIDIHLWLHPVETRKLVRRQKAESSASIAERVTAARAIQLERFREEGIFTNSQMNSRLMHKYCRLDSKGQEYLEKTISRLGLSARGCTRILKIARSIADLDGAADISIEHLHEAAGYRFLDRKMPL